MNNDEQFAESLRAQVTRVAPKIDVDVTHVVPAARRRRAARVGGVTLALGLVLGGGAWVATTLDPPGTALPGGSTTMPVEPSPSPSGPPPTSSEGDPLPEELSAPIDGPLVPPEGWREATYFHVVYRDTATKHGEEGAYNPPLGFERWFGEGISFQLTAYGPALFDYDTNLTFDAPELVGHTSADLAELPTEPEALRNVLLSDYKLTGQGGDAVLQVATRLITDSPAPPAVRAAAWELLKSRPGVEVEQDVRDSEGRLGTAATFVLFDETRTVIYDEERNRPLESGASKSEVYSFEVFFETEFTSLPDEVADSIPEIPDFTAMTREDAEAACLQEHLACTFEETESDTVPEGTVISSDPEAGALVTWGAPVTVLLSTGS